MIYLTATMTLGTISICLTVLVLNVHHRGARYPVPSWLKKLVLVYIARFMCVRSQLVTQVPTRDKSYSKKKMEKMKKNPEGNGVVDDMELLSLTVATRPANGPRVVPMRDNTATINADCNNHNICRCGANDITSAEDEAEPDYSSEWHELAHVLDRLFFWLLFLGMSASAIFILLYPQYMGIVT